MKDRQRVAQLKDFNNEIQEREKENNFVWKYRIIIFIMNVNLIHRNRNVIVKIFV